MDTDLGWSKREIKKAVTAYDLITKLFRCAYCNNYLKSKELHVCKCIKITCGCVETCFSCGSQCTRSSLSQIDSILNVMQYACKWKCGKRETGANLCSHELQCALRSVICPLHTCNHSKEGTVDKVIEHICEFHIYDFILNDDTPFYKFRHNECVMKYFRFGTSSFLLEINKPYLNSISFKVQCIKSNYKPESFMFEVLFTSIEKDNPIKLYGDVYPFNSVVQPLTVSSELIFVNYISEGKFRIVVDNDSVEDCDQFKKLLSYRILEEQNENDLSTEITCPVCLKIIVSKIYQCKNGHVLCVSCLEQVKICPVCRTNIKEEHSRSLVLEKIVQKLTIPCKNHVNGCPEKIKISSVTEHEFRCPFKITKCPFELVLGVKCEWSGLRSNFLNHLSENSDSHIF